VIYKHPNNDIQSFTHNLSETLHYLSNSKLPFLICDDININLLHQDTVLSVSNYVKTYNSYNCLELITKPTRITTTSNTLIDHIHTNSPATKLTPGILINDLSDHLFVFVSIKSKISKKWNLKNCNRHDYSNFNAENFVTEVQKALDNLPINQSNPCETLDSGILMLEQCLNEQAPIKKLSKAKQKLSYKPWITPCLLKSIKTKNRLYRALVRSGFSSQKAYAKYKKYRNKGIKQVIYWKSTKKAVISHNSCLVEMILGKCGSSLIPLLVLKKKFVRPRETI